MVTFIKKVPKFRAQVYAGLESITELAALAGGYIGTGYRIESHHTGPILFLKTNDTAGRIVENSDIRMEVGQVLVRDEAGVITVMYVEDFALQYEVAP